MHAEVMFESLHDVAVSEAYFTDGDSSQISVTGLHFLFSSLRCKVLSRSYLPTIGAAA